MLALQVTAQYADVLHIFNRALTRGCWNGKNTRQLFDGQKKRDHGQKKRDHEQRIKAPAKLPLEMLLWFSHFSPSNVFWGDCTACSTSTGKTETSCPASEHDNNSQHTGAGCKVSEELQWGTRGACVKEKKDCANKAKLRATKTIPVTYLALQSFLFWYQK